MTMITDFSTVLLDTTDNQIILPKPVNSKTLFIGRLVHILVYLLQFSIALALFPVLFIFIKYGFIIGLVSIATAVLITMFSVFITYLLYAVILRFGNEQKIKDIVGYFQIFMTIFFAVGYQVIPRLIDLNGISGDFHLHWYSYFLPPVWMAMTLESVHQLNFDVIHVVMIICSVLLPLFTFWVMIKYLAPSFANKLTALNTDTENKKSINAERRKRGSYSEKLSAIFSSSKTERSGFEMVWKVTGRDKGFKIQFYPSLAYIFVFLFVFVFKSGRDLNTLWRGLPSTKMFLFFIYLPMFTIGASIIFISFNENFPASWIYQSTPVAKPGQIITGGLKALYTKFFAPIFLILFLFAFYIWGIAVVNDFVFGFINNLFLFLVMANLSDHYLPFSRQPNPKQQSGRFLQVILQMVIIAALIGIHYFVLKNNWLIYCLIPVSAAGCYFLLKRLQNLRWVQISF